MSVNGEHGQTIAISFHFQSHSFKERLRLWDRFIVGWLRNHRFLAFLRRCCSLFASGRVLRGLPLSNDYAFGSICACMYIYILCVCVHICACVCIYMFLVQQFRLLLSDAFELLCLVFLNHGILLLTSSKELPAAVLPNCELPI